VGVREAEAKEEKGFGHEVRFQRILEDWVKLRIPFVVRLADDDLLRPRDVAMHLVDNDLIAAGRSTDPGVLRFDADFALRFRQRLLKKRIEVRRPDRGDGKPSDDLVVLSQRARAIEFF
jgi:hypothetical protein